MSKFDQLIRLRDWELDEKRRHLGQLRAELESIAGRKQALLDRIEQEKAAAQKDYAGGITLAAFLGTSKKKLAMIDEEIAAQEALIEEALVVVSDAFAEVKKVEAARDLEEERERIRLGRIEQAELDEMAQQMVRRRQE